MLCENECTVYTLHVHISHMLLIIVWSCPQLSFYFCLSDLQTCTKMVLEMQASNAEMTIKHLLHHAVMANALGFVACLLFTSNSH